MKTKIEITGQISGNFVLFNLLRTINSEEKKGMFNSFTITYKTKREAKQAIKKAKQRLFEDDQTKNVTFVAKDYTRITYDASSAYIINKN